MGFIGSPDAELDPIWCIDTVAQGYDREAFAAIRSLLEVNLCSYSTGGRPRLERAKKNPRLERAKKNPRLERAKKKTRD